MRSEATFTYNICIQLSRRNKKRALRFHIPQLPALDVLQNLLLHTDYIKHSGTRLCYNLLNAAFTRVIHAHWMAEGGHSLTPTGKIRRPSIELMCSWIVRAWDMVDQCVIVTRFLKTGVSNALDGSEDDALWQTEENVDEESESEEDYSSEKESNDA